MKKEGRIFVVSGPSGSGKTTLLASLLKTKGLRGKLAKSVSLTTRPKRAGEKEGRDYFFIRASQFKWLRRQKKLLEWTRYLDHYYATPRDFVDRQLQQGRHVILCLDLRGALAIKRFYPKNTVAIFILPPSLEELRERINKRAKTKKDELLRRLKLARTELLAAPKFDYCLMNQDFIQVEGELKRIILKRIGG